MIEVKELRKGFGGKTVLNGVNVVMNPGQCNLIIGSSGSGKTVLMKCLVGLFHPDSGDIMYSGTVVLNNECRAAQRDPHGDRDAVPGLGPV